MTVYHLHIMTTLLFCLNLNSLTIQLFWLSFKLYWFDNCWRPSYSKI